MPPAGAPERARTDAAVRDFADAASDGAPGPWRAAIRGAARDGREQLPDALDQAIAGTDLKAAQTSWWWALFNTIQWLALLRHWAALAGWAFWPVLGYLQMPVPEAPRVGRVAAAHPDGCRGSGVGHCPGHRGRSHGRLRRRGPGHRGARSGSRQPSARSRRQLVVEPVTVEVSRLSVLQRGAEAAASDGPRVPAAASRTLIRVRRFRVVVLAL